MLKKHQFLSKMCNFKTAKNFLSKFSIEYAMANVLHSVQFLKQKNLNCLTTAHLTRKLALRV